MGIIVVAISSVTILVGIIILLAMFGGKIEGVFKVIFFLGVLVYSSVVIGLFLLFLKLLLVFTPEINIMGLSIK